MMTSPTIKPRWFVPTPGRLLRLLLAVEGFLVLSERFQWFAFNQHKGWTVLIAVASVGVFLLLMLLWFLAALVFRWRFQFSILSLFVLTVAVALPCSWLATEMKAAREQRGEELGNSADRSPSITRGIRATPRASRPSLHGCVGCWGMICSSM